ncbi:MAG: hypothetical protein F6K50_01560 [Moorea sp. SIO3I7]|uniref:hypothetical protein n=1 Tax=Moorena sp. SIO3I6 TaxID=2607831 RepID=UPI0013BF57E9|nr:hypothetical protein [Moorena sp. SIO3I6]NEN94271.1 hypothetical protein [Moorena sp. SIO3I7]NEO04669.1 hypothetical protein [Moorena sp. SIO3I8]NEP23767.1 hypothetical protein [Moorena sp. SIO3I6]
MKYFQLSVDSQQLTFNTQLASHQLASHQLASHQFFPFPVDVDQNTDRQNYMDKTVPSICV